MQLGFEIGARGDDGEENQDKSESFHKRALFARH
jgi:hypothetical protein